jgi:hypothetical protein
LRGDQPFLCRGQVNARLLRESVLPGTEFYRASTALLSEGRRSGLAFSQSQQGGFETSAPHRPGGGWHRW